jgi:hypothetical protein
MQEAVSETYVTTLRIIHAAIIDQIYHGAAFVTVSQTLTGTFGADLTIINRTKKFITFHSKHRNLLKQLPSMPP